MQKKRKRARPGAKELARLESQIDLLETERSHLHEMLIRCGFSNGIQTLKETVQEVLEEQALPTEQN